MTTNVLQLPKVELPCAIANDEDWRDALAFTDLDNNPVDMTAVRFRLTVRQSDADAWIMFAASTDDYLAILPAGATALPTAFGSGYVMGEAVTLPGGLVVQVEAVGPGGAIGYVSIKTPGSFAAMPTNPVRQLSTSGSGSGAQFLLTFVANAIAILVPAAVVGRALPVGSYLYELIAAADGYTATVAYGALTVGTGASA